MKAYIYQAALWCGPCVIAAMVNQGKASPAAKDMNPADALQQIISANGFTCESDYDSGDLPKGPYEDGGGKSDGPEHCDACHVFLANPLTGDGVEYVRNAIAEHTASKRGNPDVIAEWQEYYSDVL